jgi:hypothetical protein
VVFHFFTGKGPMAKKNDGINKSEEIRHVLKAKPGIGPQEAIEKLAAKGIEVTKNLFYFVKGQIKGRNARKTRAQKAVTQVAQVTQVTRSDAVSTILKVKACAKEVGGMKNLKALVEALSD